MEKKNRIQVSLYTDSARLKNETKSFCRFSSLKKNPKRKSNSVFELLSFLQSDYYWSRIRSTCCHSAWILYCITWKARVEVGCPSYTPFSHNRELIEGIFSFLQKRRDKKSLYLSSILREKLICLWREGAFFSVVAWNPS